LALVISKLESYNFGLNFSHDFKNIFLLSQMLKADLKTAAFSIMKCKKETKVPRDSNGEEKYFLYFSTSALYSASPLRHSFGEDAGANVG
jgi:hypothetical protein